MSALEREMEMEVTITLGADGRVYFQDLPPQLLSVVAELCRGDPELALRLSAAKREAVYDGTKSTTQE